MRKPNKLRLTKTLQYEHQAKKKRIGEKDIKDKFDVVSILRKEFGLHGLTGEAIFIPDSYPVQYYRMPDILIEAKDIAIELDGPIHGNGEAVTKRPKDIRRDLDYHKTKYDLIIINYEQTNGYEYNKVISEFENHGLKRILK